MLSFALKSSVWVEKSEKHNVSSLFQEIKLLKLYVYNNGKTTIYLVCERKPTAFLKLSLHTHPLTAIKIFLFCVNDLKELWRWELRDPVPGPLDVKALSHPRCWRNCSGFLEKQEAEEHVCFKNVVCDGLPSGARSLPQLQTHSSGLRLLMLSTGLCGQFCLAHRSLLGSNNRGCWRDSGKLEEKRDWGSGSGGCPGNGTSSSQQQLTPVYGFSPLLCTPSLLAPLQRHQHQLL